MTRHTTYSSWLRDSEEATPYREALAAFAQIPKSLPKLRRQVYDVIFRESKYAWVEYRDKGKETGSKKKDRAKE